LYKKFNPNYLDLQQTTEANNLHRMKNKYVDLIEQTFDWPQNEFKLEDNELHFHGINLMDLVQQYGTPLKFTYLPKISENIKKAKTWFNVAMAKADYHGQYNYCYCTKSSHFSHVLEEALKTIFILKLLLPLI
jgi:arginine decarboxylase